MEHLGSTSCSSIFLDMDHFHLFFMCTWLRGSSVSNLTRSFVCFTIQSASASETFITAPWWKPCWMYILCSIILNLQTSCNSFGGRGLFSRLIDTGQDIHNPSWVCAHNAVTYAANLPSCKFTRTLGRVLPCYSKCRLNGQLMACHSQLFFLSIRVLEQSCECPTNQDDRKAP